MRWWKFAVPGVPIVVAFVTMLTPCIATCGDHDEAMLTSVRACPRAVELLGSDIRTQRFGFACGNTKLKNSSGWAAWEIELSGSKGAGEIRYRAEKSSGTWRVVKAELEVGAERLDILACASAW